MSEKKLEDVLEVGTWLGRRQAFAIMARRCSAADAQSLRELRESKKYKELGLTWEECGKQHAGMHRASAELIIRNLEEFGPDYFVIAQVTDISANEYRRCSGTSGYRHTRLKTCLRLGRPLRSTTIELPCLGKPSISKHSAAR
jgi:hypothetical protein